MGNAQLKQELDPNGEFADELAAGSTLMHGQYTIERFLNAGGFGITYEARDSLDRRVVIKECFPGAFCRRSRALVTPRSRAHQKELASIVRLFVQEARSLAKLDHPNIVGVHQVFEENSTAYMALDFVEGRDLLDLIEDKNHFLKPDEVDNILRQVLDAISFVHAQGILHRDISPDNILLDQDRNPVLIDFGAAREQATQQSRVLSALRVVKDGYSPQEFYIAGSEQGPYSDLYALGASFYHLLTDEIPPNSQARLAAVASGDPDPYDPLFGRIDGYSDNFLKALDKSLAILPKDRVESAQSWIDMIDAPDIPEPVQIDEEETAEASEEVAEDTANHFATAQEEPRKKSGKTALLATVAVIAIAAIGVATQTDLLKGVNVAAPSTTAPVEAPVEAGEAEAAIATPAQPAVTETAATESVAEANVPFPVLQGETDVAASVVEPAPIEVAAAPAPELNAQTPVIGDVAVASDGAIVPVAISVAPVRPEISGIAALESQSEVVPTAAFRLAPQRIDASADITGFTTVPVALNVDQDALQAPGSTTEVWAGARTLPIALTQPEDDIAPVASTTPAELPPEVEGLELAGLETGWTVALPYEGLVGGSDGETRIFAVGGTEVATRADFDATVRRLVRDPGAGAAEIEVLIGASRDTAELRTLTLPVVQHTRLPSGLSFETTAEAEGWVTRVSEVPRGLGIDMQVGDVIYGHINSGEVLSDRLVMANILARGRIEGETVFNFAIKRGDTSWFATIPFSGS